mgnify:CR=1 FL=1|jgi:prepilin-type N-terminal cleavage/methylation domain-containing protein/prepilin-type processing-associated H-X9-DG protein
MTNRFAPPRNRRAFTLIELLVVIAVIAILAAILFPVFASARERARQSACLSNMGQIARSLHMYTDDHKGRVPICVDDATVSAESDTGYWWVVLHPYTRDDRVFTCPSWRGGELPQGLLAIEQPPDASVPHMRGGVSGTYVWNETMDGAPESKLSGTAADGLSYGPSSVIAVAEGFNGSHIWKPEHVTRKHPEERLRYHHNGGANLAYADGHARYMKKDEMKRSYWAPWEASIWRP